MKQQLNSLQLYRGIASILVVFHHANLILEQNFSKDISFNWFHFGWVGVDFFFVISGFIIFYIHQSDIGQPQQFSTFIKKRFFRIYPLYWIIFIGKILISLLDKTDEIYQRSFWEFSQAFLLLPQERNIIETFLGVSWTLTYEILFYFLFGLIILTKPIIHRPIFFAWLIGILLNLGGLLPISDIFILEFIFNARNLEFILGCLAAAIILTYPVKYPKTLIISSLAMILVAIFNTKYREFDTVNISSVIAYGIPFTLLVIGSVQIEKVKQLQIPPFLIYLGNASYSIYLTHGFFINNLAKVYTTIARKLNQNLLDYSNSIIHFMVISLIVILSIITGCLTYSFVEKPLLTAFKKK